MNLTTSGRLLALLDSLAEFTPGHALIQFHDYDGSLISTLKIWAGGRALNVEQVTREDGSNKYELAVADCVTIIVHDARTYHHVRPLTAAGVLQPPVKLAGADRDWSPSQHVRVA